MMELLVDRMKTPIGELVIVADGAGNLRGVGWTDKDDVLQRDLRRNCGTASYTLRPARDPGGLTTAMRGYFAGDVRAIDRLPVALGGTDFQRKVWQALRKIPCGETWSYGELARRIGRATAVRAVGHANGDNPVSIVVPCHRVIGSDGTLTGYGGGIERKRWLLDHERKHSAG
ncbi:MAG: methylated-DNA--[protein]-cysteine S-methyltransferase [Alphaproteobacteria bacterium]|nr:methylated-DNA--[protein]-cysteine S-methyltransferase [Alphaproteobacteria bacterium]